MTISLQANPVSTITNEASVRHQRLVQAAQQFESLMLGELMKPLGKSAAIGEEDGDGSGGPLQSFGVEAMAGALAKTGALGFADRMVQAVERRSLNNSSEKEDLAAKVSSWVADNPRGGI